MLWVQTLLRWGVLDTTLCDKVCQLLATGRWFSQGPLVSSTNKTDHHNITEIVLKVALNTINQTLKRKQICSFSSLFVYICKAVWDPIIRRMRFNSATFLCLFQVRTWISILISHGIFRCLFILRLDVIIHFVDICGIVDHNCL